MAQSAYSSRFDPCRWDEVELAPDRLKRAEKGSDIPAALWWILYLLREEIVVTKEQDGLTVRHTARRNVALLCELAIAQEHEHLVRLSPKSSAANGRIVALLIDASEGGMGVSTAVFLPKKTSVTLSVSYQDEHNEKVQCVAPMRVMRVIMTDRVPTYELGLAFENADAATMRRIHGFLLSVGVGDDA